MLIVPVNVLSMIVPSTSENALPNASVLEKVCRGKLFQT